MRIANKITDLKTLKAGEIIKCNKSIGVVCDERLNKKIEKDLVKIQWIGGGCTIMDSNYPPCMALEKVEFNNLGLLNSEFAIN